MSDTAAIAFPGLGIEEFELSRVFLKMGSFTVYWYGVIICLGIILGFAVAFVRMKKIGVTTDDLSDLILFCVPSAIIGARLYYVLASLETYHSFYEMIAVWNGGLAIYGGVIAGIVSFTLVCRHKKKPLFKMYDCAAPGLILGQVIGRWGNFFNAEAYGSTSAFEFLGKKIDISSFSLNNPLRMTINGEAVQPTFLYESLWNLCGFVLMNLFFKKKGFDGEVLLWYLLWYGLGRSVIEGLRTDSLTSGNIRISQLLALLCFVAGSVIVIVMRIKKYHERKKDNGSNN